MGQQVERIGKDVGLPAGLDDKRHAAGCVRRAHGLDAHPGGRVAAPRQRVNADDASAAALEEQGGERSDGAEAEHDHLVARHWPGVEGDLQGGLDERKQRRLPQIHPGRQGHQLVTPGDEVVLVCVEREHRFAVGLSDTGVAVSERVSERSAERFDAFVERRLRIDLASVREQFRPAADPREARVDDDLLRSRLVQRNRDDTDPAWACKLDSGAGRRHHHLIMGECDMLTEVARVPLPTAWGVFDVRAFEGPADHVYLAMVHGDVEHKDGVLVRLHSECLTGDALGSLRCDCGMQLRLALRRIAAEDCGVLVYATGHEGRGVGLINKLRTYVEQDKGYDTLDANLRLGLPVDGRTYDNAAAVLSALHLRSVRLLTNNPGKVERMRRAGIDVVAVEPLQTAPHARNLGYLRTKERRMDHLDPTGSAVTAWESGPLPAVDASALLGDARPREDRPYVVLKFAQTIDGRIATSTGDAKWISGEAERRISHALRAACDAVLIGVGTVLTDDPLLTVRLVAGASPQRVVLDSTLRLPPTAQILGPDAPTTVITTPLASAGRRTALHERGVRVHVVPSSPRGVDLRAALAQLRAEGTLTLLVEGGARVITSLLGTGLVDRLVVGIAPTIIGAGTEAVGTLGITSVADGIRLVDRSVYVLEDDMLLAWDVAPGSNPSKLPGRKDERAV